MVRDGFGDESGAKLIEQRGIDFAPAEDFLQTLKAAGASEAFLNALRAAKPPEPASAKKPLNQVQVFALLAGQVPSHRVAMLVNELGIAARSNVRVTRYQVGTTVEGTKVSMVGPAPSVATGYINWSDYDTRENESLTLEWKLVVVFDICSSTSILEVDSEAN